MSKPDTKTGWVDPDEAPELDDAWFDKAERHIGGVPVPKAASAPSDQEDVVLRLDRDVLDRFRQTGPDWQARINAVLRKAV